MAVNLVFWNKPKLGLKKNDCAISVQYNSKSMSQKGLFRVAKALDGKIQNIYYASKLFGDCYIV